jgi:hypothetical protein
VVVVMMNETNTSPVIIVSRLRTVMREMTMTLLLRMMIVIMTLPPHLVEHHIDALELQRPQAPLLQPPLEHRQDRRSALTYHRPHTIRRDSGAHRRALRCAGQRP